LNFIKENNLTSNITKLLDWNKPPFDVVFDLAFFETLSLAKCAHRIPRAALLCETFANRPKPAQTW